MDNGEMLTAVARACYSRQKRLENTAIQATAVATESFLVELDLRQRIMADLGSVFSEAVKTLRES